MDHTRACAVFLLTFCLSYCAAQYAIPDVKFEAFEPSGLRISIPADYGVELFAFHGKLNKDIMPIEPGEFSEDVTKPKNGRFTYFNPTIKLKIGDVINYWVFVQHEQFGYRKDEQSWTVNNLLSQADMDKIDNNPTPATCSSISPTKVSDKNNICSGEAILDVRFTGEKINEGIWTIEQYIADAPDFEFTNYKKDEDVVFASNNLLHIRPKVTENKDDLIRTVDLTEGCTRDRNGQSCKREFIGIFQYPVTSGRLVFKQAFCFGRVEIRAKLPKGDWLFPELYLQDINNPKRRIFIAYSRGNEALTGSKGDIGARMLYGGPVVDPRESKRDLHLKSYKNGQAVANEMHTFKLNWKKDQMELYMDDIKYGQIPASTLQATGFDQDNLVRLVIGVGAGGINDFPDNNAASYTKPWRNRFRSQVKDFFESRTTWMSTWSAETSQLQVEYVKILAI